MSVDDLFQNLFQSFFADVEIHLQLQLVLRDTAVYKAQILRQDLVENKSSQRRLDHARLIRAVHILRHADFNLTLQRDNAVFISKNCLIYALEELALALRARSLLREVVDTKDHIL